MVRFLKRFAPLSLFFAVTWLYAAGPVIQSAQYVPDDNQLVLVFDQAVKTSSVLLGKIAFDDDHNGPNDNWVIKGGSVLTTGDTSRTIEIDLLYAALIDSFVGSYRGDNAYVFRLGGNKTTQISTIEAMDAANLQVIVSAGAIVNDSYEANARQVVDCTVAAVTAEPEITSITYNAAINKATFIFSDTVQFDQIAEDRSINGGLGDGNLQVPVPGSDPGEDRNANGTLDREQNVKFLNIGFTGTGGAMTLENIGHITQTADNDTLDIYLTNNDAKRIETSLGLDSNLALNVIPWAFVDQRYNPNALSTRPVTIIPDSVSFVPDSAVYNRSKNELSIYFDALNLAGREIKTTKPAPVYTKITLGNGSNSHTLSGAEGNPAFVPGTNSTAFKFKLQIGDQAAVEPLIENDSLKLTFESYAIYDNLGNGNLEVVDLPVTVISTTTPNEQPPRLASASYDEDSQVLTLGWDLTLGVGYYLGQTLPPLPSDLNDLPDQTLAGLGAYDAVADSTISFGVGKAYYSGSKKNTYFRLSPADAIRLQTYPNLGSLRVTVAANTFNAFLFLNGNVATTADDSVLMTVVADTTAPKLQTAKVNVFSHELEFDVDEPVKVAGIDVSKFQLSGNTLTGSLVPATAGAYATEFTLSLDDAAYAALMSLPDSILVNPQLTMAANNLTNIAGLGAEADTLVAPVGRTFYLKSFEAFAPPPTVQFGALKLIGNDCDIYVAEDVWGTKVTMANLLAIQKAFETQAPNDSTAGIKAIVDDYYGGIFDTDGNGKVIIFLADILDEYDLGRNDTKDSFFENGYVSMVDTTADGSYSNHGDIIYLDVDPQIIGTAPYTTWSNSTFNALAYQYALLAGLEKKPNQERWIRYGVALKLQEKAVGNVKFFGDGADSKATAANELTYIAPSLLKSRDDLYNVYNFFTYLTEKYSDPDDPLAVIKAIAQSDTTGITAVDDAISQFAPDVTTAEAFANYGTACFLDLVEDSPDTSGLVDSLYQGLYSFDALNLNAPPSGKNATNIPWDRGSGSGAPFAYPHIAPWSFNFFVSRAYFLNLEGQVVVVSPDLLPTDTLVFDGYDGIKYKVKKIMLRSGYLDPMTQDFEVVNLPLDESNSRGTIPLVTDSNFTFRDTVPHPPQGVQLLALVVSKVDYTQPPATYDFVITNITHKPDFGDFYALQNPDANNYLDLFVASQRPLYDLMGNEGAKVSVRGSLDTVEVALSKLHDFGTQATVYSGKYTLTREGAYSLYFTGRDQNGISLDAVTRDISIGMAKVAVSRTLSLGNELGQITIPGHAVDKDRWVVSGSLNPHGVTSYLALPSLPSGITSVSDVVYTANQPFHLKRTATLQLALTAGQLSGTDPLGVYLLVDDKWQYIGGQVDKFAQTITVNTNYLGRYVVAAGQHGVAFDSRIVPESYILSQNYPNPFNPSTRIAFGLPEAGNISLRVFDILGQEVATLAQGHFSAGSYEVSWNGIDRQHRLAASGVYFYVLDSENFRQVKKMILTK